jgi:hypothetical protein
MTITQETEEVLRDNWSEYPEETSKERNDRLRDECDELAELSDEVLDAFAHEVHQGWRCKKCLVLLEGGQLTYCDNHYDDYSRSLEDDAFDRARKER